MSSIIGKNLKISVFGQSHSRGIGCVIDGLPAGIEIKLSELLAFMQRRAPGQNSYSTPRREADLPEFLSGVLVHKEDPDILITCGAPLCAVIYNGDARSSNYSQFSDIPRPSHADYAAEIAYGGFQDVRGGGHFSGRLTAPLCIAGGICLQYLKKRGVSVGAHIRSLGGIEDLAFDPVTVSEEDIDALHANAFPVIDPVRGELMKRLIEECRAEGDSIGGTVECAVSGYPAGIGAPMFDGVENRLAAAMFGIPAVKGIEFGAGFGVSRLKGSENNDPFTVKDGEVRTLTNNSGGILGGITSGMPVCFTLAVKPTPTVMKEQTSVSLSQKTEVALRGVGRHDPCILPRAVPVVEAVSAIVLTDMLFDKPSHI